MSNENEKLRKYISQQNIEIYNAEMRRRKEQESPRYKTIKADSEERQEIQGMIIQMAKEGKKKIDILIQLNNRFANSPNSKQFVKWIDYHFYKLSIKEDSGPKETILKEYQKKNNPEDAYIAMQLINEKIGREVFSREEIDKLIAEYEKAKNGEDDERDRED